MDALQQNDPGFSIVLGIETSCDETAAAVVARLPDGSGRIVSNVVRTQWEKHRPYGGVVPEIAARAHVECLDVLIGEAMREADIDFSDLDAVAATAGPGLIGGLIVGLVTGEGDCAGRSKAVHCRASPGSARAHRGADGRSEAAVSAAARVGRPHAAPDRARRRRL